MNISQILQQYALANVWANPQGDRNAIFKTTKLTTKAGIVGTLHFKFANIDMPDNTYRYIVVELGYVNPVLIGFSTPPSGWQGLRAMSDSFQTLILGFSKGRILSIDGGYIKFVGNGNIIIAFNYLNNLPIVNINDDIYIRFYTNIFYNGNTPTLTQKIHTGTFHYNGSNIGNFYSFMAEIDTISHSAPTNVILFKNGLYITGLPSYSTLTTNDILEYIYDPFIYYLYNFTLDDLTGYTSTLDNNNKVVISIDYLGKEIYVDDMEFYISGTRADSSVIGIYFPRLSPSVIRMLTYKDWALDAGLIDARLSDLEKFLDIKESLTNITITAICRDNKQTKELILDSNYIPDLLNLTPAIRAQALSGVNANLPIWNANNLESCDYNKWISLNTKDIYTADMYGVYSRYGAISVVEVVQQTTDNTDWQLPIMADIHGGTLITYGVGGSGIIQVTYPEGSYTNTTYSGGQGYEFFLPGLNANDPLDVVVAIHDGAPTIVTQGFGVFCYYLNAKNVLTPAIYQVDYLLGESDTGTMVIWTQTLYNFEKYIRTANTVVNFTITISNSDIDNGIDIYNSREKVNDVGMKHLFVWVNDRYLIEGLDYNVYNGRIYLVSKPSSWVLPTSMTVIYGGLPDSSLQHVPKNTWGWVKYGKLLNDGTYDLLMYRNKSFFIDGKAIAKSEIIEKEHYIDESAPVDGLVFTDGTPYAIVDNIQFSRDEDLDLLTPTAAAEKIQDAAVSAYLTQLIPLPIQTGVIAIPNKYVLFSPFLNSIIDAVVAGNIPILSDHYSEDQLYTLTTDYLYLLKVDPCMKNMDDNFTTIQPRWDTTVINVSALQYNFISLVNDLILKSSVSGLHLFLHVSG